MAGEIYREECFKINRLKLLTLASFFSFPILSLLFNIYGAFAGIMLVVCMTDKIKNVKCPRCKKLIYKKSGVSENILNIKCNCCGFGS